MRAPTTSIFLDTNIPIYAAGTPHQLKGPCQRVLRLVSEHGSAATTSSEVLQELLHRYISIRRWDHGREVFARFVRAMGGRIEPVFSKDIEGAARLADRHPDADARDLVHASVMFRLGIRHIISTDGGFDHIDGIERLDPMRVDEWASNVAGTR